MSKKNYFICEKCGRKSLKRRYMVFIKGRFLCWVCKKFPLLPQQGAISLEKALDKTYRSHLYFFKGTPRCLMSLPSVLAERKFKIILVEDKNE